MTTHDGIVIVGAGIIGLSTAYYLSLSPNTLPSSIHIIEASPELFACASGRAGGFVVKDWFSPATAPLAALSFRLHKELADEHGGREKWGYSKSTGTSVINAESGGERGEDWLMEGGSRAEAVDELQHSEARGPEWLSQMEGDQVKVISTSKTTAQVDPLRLCKFLLDQCVEQGVRLHQPAKAVSILKNVSGDLTAIRVIEKDGREIELSCSKLVITAGAWTPRVFSTLFSSGTSIPVSPLAGHSITIRSPRWAPEHEDGGCHAVFATDDSGFSPEFFSRIGGEIYLAGLNDPSMPLPELATDSSPQPGPIKVLKKVATEKLGLREGSTDVEIVREGLCFRPITTRGAPIVCRVPDSKLGADFKTGAEHHGGVFIGSGHGPWGICQSLGTGKVLAEMVEGQTTSADVTKLSL